MDDETISTFTALTGASASQATQYLSLSDGNLEQAATLWFETGGSLADSGATTSAPPPASSRPSQPRSRGYAEDADGVIHIDSDEDTMEVDDDDDDERPPPHTENDEDMARRLQEEMYGSGGGQREPESVRAPIGRTTETLVGSGSGGWNDDDIESIVAQQMAARQARRAGNSNRAGIFNQRDNQAAVWEDDADPASRADRLARSTGGASAQSARAHTLAEMFRPPFEIISRLSWDQAREEGRDEKKWLMVNVQDPSIFDCQILNRDLWKDERVVAVIKESFIFLQFSNTDRLNNGYMQYYFSNSVENSDAYPHIAIIDPRTGEQMKVWSGRPVPKVDDFIEAIYNFLDRYSLDVTKKNPVAKRKAEQPKAFDLDRMTEEEQMAMALQQSMGNGDAGTPPKAEDPDDLTRSINLGQAGLASGNRTDEDTAHSGGGLESAGGDEHAVFHKIASDHPHEEPPADPASSTRIQFRHPGGRIIRRFAIADPVSRIFEWLKAAPPDAEKSGTVFDLMFMGKNLIDSLDSTIEAAGLKNASINIEYLED